MENNSDKQLRDKLNSTEFPFDPQAWEQMEAMLDKKKKRRGFFWWWTGGIAAVLVLAVGTIGWGVYLMDEDDKQPFEKVAVSSRQANASDKLEMTHDKSKENTAVAVGSGSEQNIEPEKGSRFTVASSQKQIKSKEQRAINSLSENSSAPVAKNVLHSGKTKLVKQHSTSASKQKRINQKEAILAQLKNDEKVSSTSSVVYNPYQNEIEMLNAASAKKSSEENISLDRKEATLLEYVSENATTSFDKKEEDVLPKQPKKIFNYSIGVLANVTGTTLGKQEWNTNRRFFPGPSFMVGLTNDFLFVNRVALTTGVLFSKTSFILSQPKNDFSYNGIIYYTSKITELNIPIGIKVYPVAKNNFRFYINVGIINHIKLKESFLYTVSNDTIANNSLVSLADATTIPVENNFTGAYAPSALHAQGVTNESTADFSINRAKRYYTSFYAGAGFEYVAKKHFVLFAEPMYYMSLQKIGVQDKRKYNFGLSCGFRYQF